MVACNRRSTAAASPAFTTSPSNHDPRPHQPPTIPTKAPLVWKPMDPPFIGFFDNDEFGSSVAVSADVRTIMIRAPGCSQTGYVKVYRAGGDSLSGNTVQLGDTYGNATGGDQLGRSEDITTDGNTIVIGSPGFWRYSDRPGYMRISSLKFNDIGLYNWKQIGHIDGEANGDEFG
jgi:hypothetical protein